MSKPVILTVDDDPQVLAAIRRDLRSMYAKDYRIVAAASGAEALETVNELKERGQAVALFLSDQRMPDMDGSEVCQRIKQSTTLPLIPKVIMCSAFSKDDSLDTLDELGCDAFIAKPFTQSDVFETLSVAFGQIEPTVMSVAPDRAQIERELGGTMVLLVEDNELSQDVACEILEQVGIKVRIANNGQEAVELVQSTPFDLVLMDIQMPVMDGLEATRQIRADGRFADLPILAMTANVTAADHQKAMDAGMNDNVLKPIIAENLFGTLHKWINPGAAPLVSITQQAADTTGLPKIKGLDISAGLSGMFGDVNLYKKILIKFPANHAQVAEEIYAALKAGNLEAARREAHSLKSLAGTMGAIELQEAAKKLEESISSKDEGSINDNVRALQNVLQPLIRRIRAAFTVEEKSRALVPLDAQSREQAIPLIESLLSQLEQGYSDAAHSLEELEESGINPSTYSETVQLEELIGRYDYEGAAEVLKELFNHLKRDQ